MTTHQPKKKTLKYYAIRWFYSRGMTTGDYPHTHACCQPARFGSKAERKAWLLRGPGPCETGHREAVTLASLPYGWGRRAFVTEASEWAKYDSLYDV